MTKVYFLDTDNRYIGNRDLSANEPAPSNSIPESISISDGQEGYWVNSKWVINDIESKTVISKKERCYKSYNIVTPFLYGAEGDGLSHQLNTRFNTLAEARLVYPCALELTDEIDWCAIQTALETNKNVHLPVTTFFINRSITVTGGRHLIGSGRNATIIIQCTNNIPIVIARGEGVCISDLQIKFSIDQAISNKWGNGIHIQKLYESSIERVYICSAYTGIYCYKYTCNDTDTDSNYIYSCSIKDLRIARYQSYAMYLNCSNEGNTGCILQNIYAVNWNNYESKTKMTAKAGFYFSGFSEIFASILNIEHTNNSEAIIITNCDNFELHGVHIEGFVTTTDYKGFIEVSNSQANISSVTASYSTINKVFAMLNIGDNATVTVDGFKERNNTVSNNFYWVYGGSSTNNANIICRNWSYNSANTWYFNNTPTIPFIKQFNDNIYVQKVGAVNGSIYMLYLPAMPTTGSWTAGTRIINTTARTVLGTAGSRYVLDGWDRITTGSSNVLNTDWVEHRMMTGT